MSDVDPTTTTGDQPVDSPPAVPVEDGVATTSTPGDAGAAAGDGAGGVTGEAGATGEAGGTGETGVEAGGAPTSEATDGADVGGKPEANDDGKGEKRSASAAEMDMDSAGVSADVEPATPDAAPAEGEPDPAAAAMVATWEARDEFWKDLMAKRDEGGTVTGKVVKSSKDGVQVDLGETRALIPSALVNLRQGGPNPAKGTEVTAVVKEVDRYADRVVLSRRAYLETARDESRTKLMEQLKVGEQRRGPVTAVADFGAFVDMGDGVEGLIHVSELAHNRVAKASDAVKVGEEVDVEVIDLDPSRGRIGLSRRRVLPDPWQSFAGSHGAGDVVECTVTRIVDFGAFADLGGGVEGLIHVSEMAHHFVGHPSEAVAQGEQLWAQIIDIDAGAHRLRLSLKRLIDG